MTPQPFLRLSKKLKSPSAVRQKIGYIFGENLPETERQHVLSGTISADDKFTEYRQRISDVGKIRRNAVYAVEFVFSASPSYFRPHGASTQRATRKQRADKFIKAAAQWAKETFAQNILCMAIHLHQRTPHIHVMVVPLLEGRLNCRELYSKRDRLVGLQESYAAALAPLGILRESREHRQQHKERIKWIREQEERLRALQDELERRARAMKTEEALQMKVSQDLVRHWNEVGKLRHQFLQMNREIPDEIEEKFEKYDQMFTVRPP